MKNNYENTSELFPGIKHEKLSKNDLMTNVNLAKEGDEGAFEKILKHLYGYICRIPQEFFIQGSQSQDVVQEACIKLLNIIEKYDESKGGFVSFAQNSIRKHIITMINKETTKKRSILNSSVSLNDSTKNQEGETIDFIDIISNSYLTASIDESLDMVQKDYEEYVLKEISKNLSEMEAKVFYLRFINGYSYKEIAEELRLYRFTKKKRKKVLDCKSVDNSVYRSKPKIKKALSRLNITTDLFEFEVKQLLSKDKKTKEQQIIVKKRLGVNMTCVKKKK